MNKTYHSIPVLLIVWLLGFSREGHAQPGFYVPSTGKIFFTGDTATIFSNVLNGGKFGVGKNAVVNFKGKIWENDPQSLITDESNGGEGANGTGGLVRFLLDTSFQQLYGGYNAATRSGPAFYQFELRNPRGLYLVGSTAKIRQELKLSGGLLYMGNNLLIVGNGHPGIISGYDSARYMVTGNAPGNGLLIRENITSADGLVIFPIGSRASAYTPGAVLSKTTQGDDYYMGVFDSVKSQLFSGLNLKDSSVNKTWEIGKIFRPDQDEAGIFLQHLVNDEGNYFNLRRQFAYVAAYRNNWWDTAVPQSTPVPGYLTSGSILSNSGANNRNTNGIISGSSYFTKFTGTGVPLPIGTHVWLNAFRTDWKNVKVYWTTKPEIDNNYFVVQRKLSREPVFSNIDTVPTKALNGTSINYLNYAMMDPNGYTGISYYRLLLVSLAGERTYSNIVAVKGKPGGYQLLLWPNPGTGRFFVGISGAAVVRTIVIWDVLGRKVREEPVNERSIIEMNLYIPGTYMVSFMSNSGELLETKKLLVQPY